MKIKKIVLNDELPLIIKKIFKNHRIKIKIEIQHAQTYDKYEEVF